MIYEALRAVVKAKTKLAACDSRGGHPAAQSDRQSCNSRLQPASAGRPDCAVGGALLKTSRETAEQMWHRNKTADSSWADVAVRIQHPGNCAQMMQSRMQPHPI